MKALPSKSLSLLVRPLGPRLSSLAAVLSLVAVILFMYLPFIYVVNLLGIPKTAVFMLLLATGIGLIFLQFWAERRWLDPLDFPALLALGFYLLFALYALTGYAAQTQYLNSIFTIRTVALINPIFLGLALWVRHRLEMILRFLLGFAMIYLFFMMAPLLSGMVTLTAFDLAQVFVGLELGDGFYQNINLNLGLLVILASLWPSRNRWVRMGLRLAAWLAFLAMFLVGGRSSVVAVVVVVPLAILADRGTTVLIRPQKSWLLVGGGIAALLIGATTGAFDSYLEASNTLRRFQVLMEGGDSTMREELYSQAVALFSDNFSNVFWGMGMDRFTVLMGDFDGGLYPHNIFLELLVEYGLVGSAPFLLSVATVFTARQLRYGSILGPAGLSRLMLWLVLFLWIVRFFSGGLGTSWVLLFFTFLLLPPKEMVST
jgi:hypothetical protein